MPADPSSPDAAIEGVMTMNLAIWLPALFVLGVASMGLCLAFAAGCFRI
jgi:hypothetical protein